MPLKACVSVYRSIMNTCKVPTAADDGDGDHRWISIVYSILISVNTKPWIYCVFQHNRFLSETREKDADVIFIGDSIIQALQHTDVWNELFAPLHCLNFGIHRDKIENVLWRVHNGELDNVKPKVRFIVEQRFPNFVCPGLRYFYVPSSSPTNS